MEELSIEEKAKRYDEAAEIIMEDLDALTEIGAVTLNIQTIKNCFYRAFPELKESEDERIRKELLQFVDINTLSIDERHDRWIAWLQKQGKHDMGISEATKQELKDNLNKALAKETPESWNKFLDEQQPAWSEEDEKMLDSFLHKLEVCTLLTNKENMWILDKFKSLKDRYTWKPSDEQLHYLHWIANIKLGDSVVEQEVSKHLNALYEDLKKLKGE